MHTLSRLLLALVASASLAACGASDSASSSDNAQGTGVNTSAAHEAAWSTLHIRGTMNDWGTTPMQLVADHEWSVEVTTGTSSKERFKFDVHGDWRLNFGDNDRDQTADRSGKDIPLPAGQTVLIHFNDQSNFYWVEERRWQADVSIELPEGVDAQALAFQQAQLSVDGEAYGWNYVYVDEGRPYVPVCCLAKGAEGTLSFDSLVGGKRLVGEVTWVVDGTMDPIPLQMSLVEATLEGFGGVELSVLADRWENDRILSSPYGSVSVFLGDWQAGNVLGHTGSDGKVSLMIPGGEHKLSAMLMTSSHSIASASTSVNVIEGSIIDAKLHMAPTQVVVRAYYDTGVGRALYITGASDYLGNWKTASRMDWSGNSWGYQSNLPMGVPFKIVMAPWSDDRTISTSGVTWEKGSNRIVTPPNGSYYSDLTAHPSF
jgi:hypothetical protein